MDVAQLDQVSEVTHPTVIVMPAYWLASRWARKMRWTPGLAKAVAGMTEGKVGRGPVSVLEWRDTINLTVAPSAPPPRSFADSSASADAHTRNSLGSRC